MKTVIIRQLKTAAALAAACLLSACATKSHVRSDGTTDNPVFPKPYSLTFNKDRGTFPTADELDKMRPGLTKDEIYKILGRPHYDEGLFGVREWDYLFHFYTPGVGADPQNTSGVSDVTTCQYKVIFDKHKFARSFYWKPVYPENAACPPVEPKPEPVVKEVIREIVREVSPTTPPRIRQ